MKDDINKHRSNVMLHLTYIREMVDASHDELKRLNGRVRENEKQISWMKGIGTTITFAIASVLAWLGISD
jgi:hypothetical protein